MTFQSFLDALQSSINARFGDGTTLQYKRIVKNNGVGYTGAYLSCPDRAQRTQIAYIEPLYHSVECGLPLQTAAELLLNNITGPMPEEIMKLDLESYEDVKDKLFLRLIGKAQNEARMPELAGREFMDMMIVYSILLSGPGIGNAMTEVSRKMLELWGVSEEEVYGLAMENTPKLLPPVMKTLREAAQIPEEPEEIEHIYVLTNTVSWYGASAILYSDQVRALSERYDSDIFILPTSLHETILIPAGFFSGDFLSETLRTVNRENVPKEDVLTDSLYLFRKESGRIVMAD